MHVHTQAQTQLKFKTGAVSECTVLFLARGGWMLGLPKFPEV